MARQAYSLWLIFSPFLLEVFVCVMRHKWNSAKKNFQLKHMLCFLGVGMDWKNQLKFIGLSLRFFFRWKGFLLRSNGKARNEGNKDDNRCSLFKIKLATFRVFVFAWPFKQIPKAWVIYLWHENKSHHLFSFHWNGFV